jgi:tripartite-type tricarboxylate transporter receptor subunit TctC
MTFRQKKIMVLVSAVVLAAFSLTAGMTALAADYPSKSVTMYIPFSAGGSMDSSSRVLAAGAEKVLGQPFVMINKTGGGGTVALGVLANEKPDGYILSAGTSTGIFRIPVQRKVPYKPLADFTHIFAYAAVSSGVVVKPDAPWQTWQEFVDYAKKNPGKVKYSTTGAGSPMHVSMEVAAEKEGIKWIHIPYKGSMPSITAVLGGHVDACSSGPKFVSMVQQGQLRVLGVHTKERMVEFPDVPTFVELGYNYINDTFFSVHGPAGMDPAVVRKLEDAFAKSVATPAFKDMAKKFALQPLQIHSAEYSQILEDGWPKQVQIFKDLGRIKEAATQPR